MALLPDIDRERIWRYFNRWNKEPCAFSKADLRAAVDATDTWIDGNASSYNTALPVAFRTNATALQKTILFCWVAMRRAGILKVQEDG